MLRKKLPIIFLLVLISNISFAKNTSENKVLQTLNAYFKAWESRDIHEIGKLYANSISAYNLPSDSSTSGKQNVLKTMQDVWLASAPDMVWIRTSPPMFSGNSVSYEWLYSGTYSGMWGKSKINKKPFSVKGISITTINDKGKIILQKDYYDLKSFESQLGIKGE